MTQCWYILDSITSKQCHAVLYIGMGRIISCWPALPFHVETEIWSEREDEAVKEIEAEVWGSRVNSSLCCSKVVCAPHCSWCCPTPFYSFIYIMHYITSRSINGSRLYYTLLIHAWLSDIKTGTYCSALIQCFIRWYLAKEYEMVPRTCSYGPNLWRIQKYNATWSEYVVARECHLTPW